MMLNTGITAVSLGGFVLFGACSLMFIFQKRWDSWTDKIRRDRIESANCQIKEDHFYFPKGYYFKHSSLGKSKKLPYTKIQEIRINTHPVSALTNNNELIFLRGLTSDDIESNGKLSMKLKRRVDLWSLLLEEFLDTEFSEAERRASVEALEKAGITETEQLAIRKKFKFRFMLRTMATWEWVYYGQYDVLTELWPLTSEKYWWTMDIALRKRGTPTSTIN